jgi:hypothetical protein
MFFWYVVDPTNANAVGIVGTTLNIPPPFSMGPAAMIAPNVPVPQQSVSMQLVNGVLTPVVNQAILQTLLPGVNLSGLKLF